MNERPTFSPFWHRVRAMKPRLRPHVEITRHCVAGQYRFVISDLQTRNGLFIRVSRTILADQAAAVLNDLQTRLTKASAVVLANSLDRAKLIVFTHHGTMARYVSNMRPERAPIFAFTSSEQVYRQIALCWGTYPILIEFTDDPNETVEAALKQLRARKLTEPGDNLIVLSDMLAGGLKVDCVQLRPAK